MKHPEFAKRLKEAIQESGIHDTQANLAKEFGVSGPMVWAYKNGEKLPSMEQAIRMAGILNYSVEYLLTGKGHKRPPTTEDQALLEDIKAMPESSKELVRAFVKQPTPTQEQQAKLKADSN